MPPFRILGSIECGAGGHVLTPEPTMVRGLLAALLLHRGQWVSRSRLVALLWDKPPTSAVVNLRGYAMRLRRMLATAGLADRLHTLPGRGCYRLAATEDDVDSGVFTVLHADGRSALRDGSLAEAVHLLDQAVGLWRGPAGEDVPDTVELQSLFDALNEHWAEAVEDAAEARLLLGEPAVLVPELMMLTARYPLRERAWELQLWARCAAGDWLGAARSYQRLVQVLDDLLGTAPSPRLRGMHRAILLRDLGAVTPLVHSHKYRHQRTIPETPIWI